MKDAKNIAGFRIVRPEIGRAFGANAMWIYSELANIAEMHEDADGWFYATREMLEAITGLSRTAIQAAIDKLQAAELVMVDIRGAFYRKHFRLAPLTADVLVALSAEQVAQNVPVKVYKKSQLGGIKKASQVAQNVPVKVHEKDQLGGTNHASNIEIEYKEIENTEIEGREIEEKESAPSQKPKKEKPDFSEAACRLIDHLNAVAGTAFRHVKTNIRYISRVLETKEGTEEEFRMVIEHRAADWKNNPEMHKYLNPETLSRPNKFPGYLEKAYSAQKSLQLAANASGDMSAALVPQSQSDGLQIILPNGQQFGSWYEKKDQRKIDMIKAQLIAHPGMEQHLNPQLADPAYLSALREIDLQNELRTARNIHQVINYKPYFGI
jgi:uncharacterized phage protein (TIGR02220 family)